MSPPGMTHKKFNMCYERTSTGQVVIKKKYSMGRTPRPFAQEPEDEKIFQVRLYGFIDAYAEKVAKTPGGVDANGETIFEDNPYEFDVPNVNVMVQGSIHQRFRFFLNLAAPGSGGHDSDTPIGVRNAWVEAGLFKNYLAVRAGKLYRRFGLYNEILDAVPTFIGIEPPELFDKDHLMVTRTTNLMLFGRAELGKEGKITANYAVTTGNDERMDKAIPVGADANLEFNSWLTLGSSFYHSGGPAGSTVGVGDGSPRGGVLPWMTQDEYYIIGGYAQVQRSGATVQAEYWEARHDGERDPDALTTIAAETSLSPRQLNRFFVGGDPLAEARTDAKYTIRTAYLRFGWQFPFAKRSSVTPYIQGDYYSNPETIAEKDYGGDNEAGLADDGSFQKYTLGLVIRPVPQVALKLDGSTHVHTFNGDWLAYPEGRISFSYLWELPIGQ
ncbi:MAG: hypothetical protein KUG77_01405 [Nannocystaceae bacterium]|nr:hypothetical protein [Nannocystaceae bacterium]